MSFSVPDSLFWTIVLFLVGLGLICIAGDKFVDAAVAIAKRLKIPQIVVGATIVSLGTTLPEILVSTTAAVGSVQSPDISVGNALGSIICNTALIAGIGQLIRPAKDVKSKSVSWRMLFFVATALVLFLSVLFTPAPANDFRAPDGTVKHFVGTVGRIVGIVLVLGFCVYAFLSIKLKDSDGEAEYDETEKIMPLWGALLMLVISAAGLFVGANLLVENGQVLALDYLKVPERVVAVTMIALGTSLPELVTTVTSSIKGQGDVGLGNIIGANLFNMLLVLGLPATITGNIAFTAQSLYIDLPLALLVMVGLIVPMLIRKKGSRVHGALLVLGYIGYCVWSFIGK